MRDGGTWIRLWSRISWGHPEILDLSRSGWPCWRTGNGPRGPDWMWTRQRRSEERSQRQWTLIVMSGTTPIRGCRGLPPIFCSYGLYFMRFWDCTYIFFCIAEYRGTQDMYISCIFLIYIYIFMHMDALFCL